MSFETIFGFASKLASGVTGAMTADVLRERIGLINDQMQILHAAHAATEEELTKAKAEIEALRNELAGYRAAEQVVITQAAAFKKDASGRYSNVPLCPNCLNTLGGGSFGFPLQCFSCKHVSNLNISQVDNVVSELNRSLE